jgi:hypothetical protein
MGRKIKSFTSRRGACNFEKSFPFLFYLRTVTMKRFLVILLKAVGLFFLCLLLLALLGVAFVLFMDWRDTWNHECEKGPLASVTSCQYDQSSQSWMNSGWWHSDAAGPLDPLSCEVLKAGKDQMSIVEKLGDDPHPTVIYKVSCELFAKGEKGVCYASQRAAVNGNSRYVKILMANGCENVRYFEGSKYSIVNGEVTPVNWGYPYEGIPDENTGKVPTLQIEG